MTLSNPPSRRAGRAILAASLALPILLAFLACDDEETGTGNTTPQSDAGDDGAPDGGEPDGFVPPDSEPPDSSTDPVCGDGALEGDEECDDGNLQSGDGCNSTCTYNDLWDAVGNASTAGDQNEVTLSCDANHAVMVFTDWNEVDLSGATVRARLFGPDGMPRAAAGGDTAELTVNDQIVNHQRQPRVALRPDGSFIVVWRDESLASGLGADVRGRLFAADGSAAGPSFLLTSVHDGEQATPALAVSDSGGFMAVWEGPDASGYGIWGRLFGPDGQPQYNTQTGDDGAFRINQVTAGNQMQPDVAWINGDRYLVVWADGSGQLDGASYGVAAMLLDAQGSFLGSGSDFLVNTTTTGMQASPRAAWQPGLGAVVVWTDESQVVDPHHYGIRARLLDPFGAGRPNAQNATDGDFQVNLTVKAGQQLPAVSTMADGRFAVAWQDWSADDGSGAGIRSRVFEHNGLPLPTVLTPGADDLQVNTTYQDAQLSPTICTAGSWFFVAWEDQSQQPPDQSGSAVRYRLIAGP